MREFDYIIAGSGAAGLTLAFLLMEHEYSEKKVLIIDKDLKENNDRTWCFWQKGENMLEQLVHKQWGQVVVKGSQFEKSYQIAPYSYKMIRGIDFYHFMKESISIHPNVTWINEEVTSIEDDGTVSTNSESFKGELVFNSIFNYQQLEKETKQTTLLQHFLGYIIETDEEHFNPDECTYMDFSIDQEGDCRFCYILPFSENSALIEYTLFNQALLKREEYETRLKQYINKLGIQHYKIKEVEYGIIPMTDYPFANKQSDSVINIGINGGYAKASTGYSFLRAQQILGKMAKNIQLGLDPTHSLPHQKARFKKYDATLLNVLASGKYTGEEVFTNLFKKNGAHAVFKFLDEETNLPEELKIMSSTPILDFGKAFIQSVLK
mgnify:CR=1 FL=1